ncbi:hypothetical protein [Planobispora longispora]|uniref:Uncharacterized protein n=1 Tax=Planobispora longispora TaxID=28887 RepID=A0A8J3RJW0_9ACTN|nr:hypothetical protein [Planobispora longispora]BFE85687.1 hypothetical protein GCM10020093_082880 [Planobispora longispora]GIH76245.1 hypothetical protein Plo01_26740 [Planobispora longispora]
MHGNSMPDTYVYVTEEGVTRHYADGSVDALAWEDVVEVRVVGDVAGEKDTEILYVLLDRDGQGCVVPKSATDGAFLTRLRYLPDFDLDRLMAAVDVVRDSYVVVWRSPEPPSALPDLEYD